MKYLLDTHAIIWYFEDSPRLPHNIAELIDNPEINICVCSISLWEIAIKVSLGKLELRVSLDEIFYNIKDGDYDVLQIENEYLQRLSSLPFLHKDPFDRLLIASAIAEDLTIITADENIQKYNVKWTW
jgi:PIN domain nuclease of toxin-antitoxin system